MKSFKQFLLIENKEELINQLNSLFKKEKLGSDTLNSYLPLVEEIYARFKGSNLYQFLSTVLKDLILTENGKKAKVKSISKKEFKDLLMELEHFYAYDFIKKHYKLVAKKPYDQVLRELEEQEDEWKKTNPQFIPPDGKKILTFPDGYFWVDLEKHKCDMESQAMGHCGTAGSPNETLLSLRKEVKKGNKTYHEPHLTFSLRPDGYLTEMRGKENSKPSEKYHKYIIALLNHTRIKGIKGDGYNSDSDFSILDLHPDQWKKIYAKNKNMLDGFSKEYHDVAKIMVERDLTKEEQLEYVKKYPHLIQLFVDADEDVQLAAVKKGGPSVINLMKNPTPQVIDFALNEGEWYLPNKRTFNKMSDKQKMKLEQNQLAAVENDWKAIKGILSMKIKPSEAIQLAAVERHLPIINIITGHNVKPSEKVISFAIKEGWFDPPKKFYDKLPKELKKNIEENQIAAMKTHKGAIRRMISARLEISEAVQLAAVEHDFWAWADIINLGIKPPEAVQLAALRRDYMALRSIVEAGIMPSEAVQLAAVKKDLRAIVFIEYVYGSVIEFILDNYDEDEIHDILFRYFESKETKQKLQTAFDEKYGK